MFAVFGRRLAEVFLDVVGEVGQRGETEVLGDTGKGLGGVAQLLRQVVAGVPVNPVGGIVPAHLDASLGEVLG